MAISPVHHRGHTDAAGAGDTFRRHGDYVRNRRAADVEQPCILTYFAEIAFRVFALRQAGFEHRFATIQMFANGIRKRFQRNFQAQRPYRRYVIRASNVASRKFFWGVFLGSVRRSAKPGLRLPIVSEVGINNSDYRDYFLIVGVYTDFH
ncbi:hypothetical protein [Paraburkholderia bannensis]|uniref:hypothetical protein n=1 Tax=Paraburkholderia bannensis TaxID=765414 RepID=UPI002AB75F9E|nr:hypothetical protein [Paraburkholderia bannensis]